MSLPQSSQLLLLVVLLLGLSLSRGMQVEFGTYTSSCTQICSAADLLCADSMIQSMDCASVAATYCNSRSMTSNSNIGCTVSGCYVNCQDYYYYSKSSSYSSCNTAGTCLTSSANLYKYCPCYEASDTKLETWAVAGLYLAGGLAVVSLALLGRMCFKSLKGDSKDHEALDSSESEYDVESGESGGVLSAFSGIFGRKSAEVEVVTKKKKKSKKKYKTKLPNEDEMDETRDMAIK